MKNGYDQFFKQARTQGKLKSESNAQNSRQSSSPQANSKKFMTAQEFAEKIDRPRDRKEKAKKGIPWKMASLSFFGILLVGYSLVNIESFDKLLTKLEVDVGVFESGMTQESKESDKDKSAKEKDAVTPAAGSKAETEAEGAGAEKPEGNAENQKSKGQDFDHLTTLAERKKQLDIRETELQKMEADIEEQRKDLEKKISELEDTRRKIASVLEDKVKVDEAKLENLVQMYSSMKPPQAAKVFETMDEDLVVEVIGRMKKKNAAEILNLMKAEKAQIFSERYAGYKRKK